MILLFYFMGNKGINLLVTNSCESELIFLTELSYLVRDFSKSDGKIGAYERLIV